MQLLALTLVKALDAVEPGSRLGVHSVLSQKLGSSLVVQLLVVRLKHLHVVVGEHLFDVVDHLLLRSGRLGSARGELPAEATLLSVTHDTELVLLVRAALLEESLELLLGSLETLLELNSLRLSLEILLHDSNVDMLG